MAYRERLLTTGLGGALTVREYTINYTDLTDTAGTSKTLTLFTLPAGAVVAWARAKHTVAFAGPSISDMSFVVGISGVTNWLITDLDIDAAVANTTLVQSGVPTSNVGQGEVPIIATVGSTGANLSVLTAGSVWVRIAYWDITTP